MSKSHRTDLEIIFDILEFCSEPRKQTRIMYRNNLNYNVLKNYLSKLSTLGLLCKNAPYYVTTEKGRQFVSKAPRPAILKLPGLQRPPTLPPGKSINNGKNGCERKLKRNRKQRRRIRHQNRQGRQRQRVQGILFSLKYKGH